jgi:hypothetical protein
MWPVTRSGDPGNGPGDDPGAAAADEERRRLMSRQEKALSMSLRF